MTNNYNLPAVPTSGDKCYDLYARVQVGTYAKNVGREVEEIQYVRESDECTHNPQINEGLPAHYLREKNLAAIPGMISAIERGIRARHNKIQKEIATDRNPRTSQAIAEIR